MKSIQNLLRSNENNSNLNDQDLKNTKGGTSVVLEAQIDITCQIDGVTTLLYCDRRRKRIGA